MAHGFSAVKEMHLAGFAERFRAAGFAVLVFDYRHQGASDGEPRAQVLPDEQLEDYRSALGWLSARADVDASRLGVWGTSYSGGHVLRLGAFDRRVRCVVSQVPALCLWRQLVSLSGREGFDFLLARLADARRAGADPFATTLPVVGPEGSDAVLPTPDAFEWFREASEPLVPAWDNRVSLASVERLVEYAPAQAVELISPTPLLLVLAERDTLIPVELGREVFARAGEPKRLVVLPCGHFDVYAAEPWHAQAADAAVDWFRAHLR
jgi:fermentation-respiration switch protein FrsA (DUF1100 family)